MHDSQLKNVLPKFINDISHSNDESEFLSIDIINNKKKIYYISTCYRQPASKVRPFRKHLRAFVDKTKIENKKIFIVGHFNIKDT